MPLVVTPAVDGVSLAEWVADHRDELDGYFDKHGAILFRGFDMKGADDFEAVASRIVPDLFAEYGDLPPEGTSERIYHSTPYPADKMILFHSESSHLPKWPMRQFFFCIQPARGAGRDAAARQPPRRPGRSIPRSCASSRRRASCTSATSRPASTCRGRTSSRPRTGPKSSACAPRKGWTASGRTATRFASRQNGPGVAHHPRTGEKICFNQVQLHHVSCLDPETRDSLRQLFAEEDMPRNVYFGDGSVIPDETVDRISEVFEELCVELPWEKGDLIALDNMFVQHARRPFIGERKILVAMGQMVSASDLEETGAPA